jgi:predicted nucleotidyltransferase
MSTVFPTDGPTWLERRTIFLTRAGSQAYGTALPTSDLDIRGIAVAPREYYLGFAHRFQQAVFMKPEDLTVFELQKFFRLASACNPNVLETLFTLPRDHLLVTHYGQMVLEKRDLFLSRVAAKTFVGYAHGQIRRLQSKLNPDGSYDTKNAMHVVRLLREGKELLETGKVNVFRQDREELLAIRAGAWSLVDLLAYAAEATADLDRAVLKSPLPVKPDLEKLDELCRHVVELAIGM